MAPASKRTRARSKRQTAKPASKDRAQKAPGRAAARAAKAARVRVRMYRQGFGDCFLVTLPRSGSRRRPYHILIDCGVILGTPDPEELMTSVVEDIRETTGGEIDLLVVTHEHWDHVSGFTQAAASFQKLTVHEVWLAWTEDPKDELAAKLREESERTLAALRISMQAMALAGDQKSAADLHGLLGFFGARGASVREAIRSAGRLGPVQYKRPGDIPVQPKGVAARIYVLGPPQDEKAIRRTSPSKRSPETYGLTLERLGANLDIQLEAAEASSPFAAKYVIPLAEARQLAFFKSRYWGPGSEREWRGIDAVSLDDASELALRLDSKTNNTSLVLAIELSDGDVLLFAADAQVGNWLSWQSLAWSVDGRRVTGPDLLKRTVLYKVGHHGSHNATLREKGLELMTGLRYALVPVHGATAEQKRWGRIPLEELMDALKEKNVAVLRVDDDPPIALPGITPKALYYEVEL